MAVTTVAQLAAELNRPAAALLEQLKLAGVSKASTDDALTESDKERLLDYLRSTHGTATMPSLVLRLRSSGARTSRRTSVSTESRCHRARRAAVGSDSRAGKRSCTFDGMRGLKRSMSRIAIFSTAD
jgi:hypothetical protein